MCLISACIDPIELEIPSEDFESNIVVNGLLTEGDGPFEIQIVQTGPPGTGKFEAAPVANAWVEDGEGNAGRCQSFSHSDPDQRGMGIRQQCETPSI